jgi:hypothetical protein
MIDKITEKLDDIYEIYKKQYEKFGNKYALGIIDGLDIAQHIIEEGEGGEEEPKRIGVKDNWEYIQDFCESFGRLPKDADELDYCISFVEKRKEKDRQDSET